jgi:glutathione synthase/RimK-type ligase-like ATP-grasp enzyme
MILVISSKKVYAAKRLAEEAAAKHRELSITDVDGLVACDFNVDITKFDVLYIRDPFFNGGAEFLPQIIALAKKFKAAGKKVVDSSIADGKLGMGKWADYQQLQKSGLPIPTTRLLSDCPLPTIHYPLILKWTYGFKAKDVFLIKNEERLKNILPLHHKKEWLIQEFIQADYEYKIITVGYKALPVILRFGTKGGGFRVDFKKAAVMRSLPPLMRGGSGRGCNKSGMTATSLSSKAFNNRIALGDISPQEERACNPAIISLAESASLLLGRELAKVDILESAGKFYILEVNRFPGLKSFEEITGYNVFKDFLGYLILK